MIQIEQIPLGVGGLEKRADLEYDVLVKRKNKTGKKPGF